MAFGDPDASTPAFVNVNTGWTTTGGQSAPFTPPADSLVRLAVFADTSAAANPGNETVTDTLGGATGWTFQGRRSKPDAGSQAGSVALWTKYYAASPGSIQVTVVGNATGGAAGGFSTKAIAGCTGVEGYDEGSNTAAVMSTTVTTVTANARCEMAGTDWNVQAAPTAGAGQTAVLSSAVGAGPDTRVYVGIQNAVTATPGTVVTMSTASPSTGNANNFIAWALTPSAGAPAGASPSGIAVPATPGTPTAALGLTTAPTGLAVAAAAGTPATAIPTAGPSGLAVPVALGVPATAIPATAPAGVALAVALGTPTVALNLAAVPSGIAVAVAAGQPSVVAGTPTPAGIALTVALGQPSVALNSSAAPVGIAVGIAAGQPSTAHARAAAPAGVSVPVAAGTPSAGAGRPVVVRPNTGLVTRPNTGTVTRPNTGRVVRPNTGTVTRPNTGRVIRP